MATHRRKHPDLVILVTNHDEGLIDEADGDVIAGLGNLVDSADTQPVVPEAGILLELVERVRCIEVRW
jgi:hypothetical protein